MDAAAAGGLAPAASIAEAEVVIAEDAAATAAVAVVTAVVAGATAEDNEMAADSAGASAAMTANADPARRPGRQNRL